MHDVATNSIGGTWKELVAMVVTKGSMLASEGIELTDVRVVFKNNSKEIDSILEKYADSVMIENMMKVFFVKKDNELGHSYADLIRGPLGRDDFTDIVELLNEKNICKRATLTLCGNGNGKVPCINVINFLIRDNKLDIYYFSRGQDAYKKFYADAFCIAFIQSKVANILDIEVGIITGYIASAHVYFEDMDKINEFIEN